MARKSQLDLAIERLDEDIAHHRGEIAVLEAAKLRLQQQQQAQAEKTAKGKAQS